MATVRINNQIRYHVENKIKEAFNSQYEANKSPEELDQFIGDKVYREVFPDAKRIANELNLPKQYGSKNKKIRWIEFSTFLIVRIENTCHYKLVFTEPQPIPTRTGRWSDFILELTREEAENITSLAPVLKYYDRIAEINKEKEVLINTLVKDVLQNCSTLRQVLEIWPTALEYMPEDVLKRHHRKAEKGTRSPSKVDNISIPDNLETILFKTKALQ